MKKCLVIGSNGFLGNVLCRSLYQQGYSVLGVYHENFDNLYGKIKNIPIKEFEWTGLYDYIFITSAYIPRYSEKVLIDKLYNVNTLLPSKVCNAFPKAKIIYCSTVSVYEATDEIITEESKVNPKSEYGISKLRGEQVVSNHFKYSIIRISSIYGPKMYHGTFLPKIVQNVLENNKIVLYGNGERQQNYIHVNDAVKYVMRAAFHEKNSIFLATDTRSYSNNEVARYLNKFIPDSSIHYLGEDNSPSFYYNNEWTKKTLEVSNSYELENSLLELVQWMKK